MHKVCGEAGSPHTLQQSHDAHVSCSDFSAHDCELQVHKFATANATAVNSISGSREFLVTAGRSDFILFRHFCNSRGQAHGGASCMNFGKLCTTRPKAKSSTAGQQKNETRSTLFSKTSVHAIWLHRAGITLFNRLLVGHHPSLVYDVTFD